MYDTKFQTHVGFLFPIFYFTYHLKFSFDAQNLPFVRHCSHVISLLVPYVLQQYTSRGQVY